MTGAVWSRSYFDLTRVQLAIEFILSAMETILIKATHLLEYSLALIEVQSAKDDLQVIRLVTLVPALGNEVPFRFKFTAHSAAIANIHCRQNDGRIVISRGIRQLLEGGIV